MPLSVREILALSFLVVALAGATRAQSVVARRPLVGPDATLVGRADARSEAADEAVVRGASPWESGAGLERVDGVLYGAGPRYKVEFGANGFRYTTALGARAPIDGTLAFQLESIRLGERELAAVAPVEPEHAHLVATYARGPSIREEYVVQPDGLEQRFVFDSLPSGGGDLVVRGRVATSLVARDVDDTPGDGVFPLGIRFELPDYGGFVYGGVTGIDANGARAPGLVRFDGEHIELSLPASFVEHAALPLVLDPLLGSNTSLYSGPDVYTSDVAYDATHNLYLVVWTINFSGSNADVYGQRITPSAAPVGGYVFIEPFTTASSGPATVANNNGSNRFLVAWSQHPSSLGGSSDLACRIVNASNGGITNTLLFAINGSAPEAGGEMLEGYLNVQVVWQTGSGIQGRPITVPAVGDPGFGPTYVLTSSSSAYYPSISKSGGVPGRYVVAWTDFGPAYPKAPILARTVDYNGVLGPAAIDVSLDSSAQKSVPAVDGDGTDFLIAYESFSAPFTSYDLRCKRVHWTGSGLTPDATESPIDSGMFTGPYADVVLLGGSLISGTATKYAVGWEDLTAATGMVLRYRELDPATCLPCGQEKTLGTSCIWVALASEAGGGASGATDGGMAVFNLSGGGYTLKAQPIEALGVGGSVVNLGGGCAGGGTASVLGPVAVGNKQFEFRLNGAVSSATFAVHNMSFAPTSFPCGSCSGFLPGILHTRPLVGGAAIYPSPIPCSASAIGVVVDSDWIVLSVPTVPCPAFANIANSNVQRLTVGE